MSSYPKGTLHVPISRRRVNSSVVSAVRAVRKSTVPVSLENEVYSYVAEFQLGTPGQNCKALLDTGSSDLWVFSTKAVQSYGYDSSKSSTYNLLSQNGFQIQYVSGSAQGDWVTDSISVGGASLTKQQFAVVNDQSADQEETIGVFGISRTIGESVQSQSQVYPNVPANLKAQGVISVLAYSLYLDDLQAASGGILFGGVDKSKFTGTLGTVPFTAQDRLEVAFSLLGNSYKGVLDSGTSLTYLPSAAFDAIKKAHNWDLQYDQSNGNYYVTEQPSGSGIVYTFGGVQITVPITELFIQQGSQWIFTVLTTDQSDNIILLGDSTLRSAYVVYDLDNNQAAIAQASYSSAPSQIQAITGSTIPFSTGSSSSN